MQLCLLCTRCWNYFFPVPCLKLHLLFQAKTSRQPRGPWCHQNKFNICHRIKWLCRLANEKPQTFENCLATLPAHKKLSVTSFFRRISHSVPPPLCSLLFSFYRSLLPFLFTCRMSSPSLATESKVICFRESNGRYSTSSWLFNRSSGCGGLCVGALYE